MPPVLKALLFGNFAIGCGVSGLHGVGGSGRQRRRVALVGQYSAGGLIALLVWRGKAGPGHGYSAADNQGSQPSGRQTADYPPCGPDCVRCYKEKLPGIHVLPSIFIVRNLHYDRFCHLARCDGTFLLTYQFILI